MMKMFNLSGKGTAANFESADDGYMIIMNDDGEAEMIPAVYCTDWAGLQAALNQGGTAMLTQDITAGATDRFLNVPSGKTVTLDLNGHTLSRGLTNSAAAAYGYVIKNEGTLTITDSAGGGTITGGNNAGDGGGIYNTGTLTLNGGTITGNKATGTDETGSGGGIFNKTGGTLTVNGGCITNNIAVGFHGGGVYNGGTMNLQGGSITGNVVFSVSPSYIHSIHRRLQIFADGGSSLFTL